MTARAPSIAVVIAVLNSAGTLQRCLQSVVDQTHAERQLIIMDGGSTDASLDIIRSYDERVTYWESRPDKGLYDAFNKAVAKTSADWIYFLGADDYLWDSSVLERIAPHLASAQGWYRIVYGRAAFVSPKGETLEMLGKPWPDFKRRFLQGFMLPHQAVFHHRSLFARHGPFDDSFRMGGDYEMLLRELKSNDALFVPDVIVAGYQFGGDSSSPGNAIRVLEVVRRAQRRNGIRFPGVLWYLAAARVYIRLALWKVLGEAAAKRVLDLGRAMLGKPRFWTRV